jgi:arylsulfatase A-like enzyme
MNPPRHIVWITADHMRYDCIAAHGNPAIHTPHLDELVRGGVSFDHCYAQNPLCMPSRASFMTGLYPQQTGLTWNGQCLPPDFPFTPPRMLKRADFQAAQIGKLHFQPHEESDLDPRPRHDYGFDILQLAEEPGPYEDAYVRWLRSEYPQHERLFRVPRSVSPRREEERIGTVLDAPWEASFSGWIAEQFARHFTRARAKQRQFVHCGFYAPHPPLNPTAAMFAPYHDTRLPPARTYDQEWQDKPEPLAGLLRGYSELTDSFVEQYRRHFFAMVTGLDMGIGRIIETLKSTGAYEDSLIIFSSDHGDMCGDHRMILKQHSFYDEVMRVPLVLHGPAAFGGGRRVNGLFELVDLMPTVLELCDIRVPEVLPGRSRAGFLRKGDDEPRRESVLAVDGPGHIMLRTPSHKYIRYASGAEVLYDLADPDHERLNHADEPQYDDVRRSMRHLALERFIAASRSILPRHYRF